MNIGQEGRNKQGCIRVLCVDDDQSFLELLSDRFSFEQFEIDTATEQTASAGIERLDREQFDCVLSDYHMPRMNGVEFLEAVRERWPLLPFLLVTGQGSESVASEAVSAGVTDYVSKSTAISEFELLANRIENVVQQYRARANYRQIFQGVNDAVLVIDEQSGRIVDANAAAEDMWGYSPEEFPRLSISDLTVNDRTVMVDGTFPGSGEFEWQCETVDGRRFWGEVSLKRDEIEGRERTLLVTRDVTTRKRRERALERLLDSVRHLMVIESPDGIVDFTAEVARDVLGAERAAMYLRDDRDGSLEPVTNRGSIDCGEWSPPVDRERVQGVFEDGVIEVRARDLSPGPSDDGAVARVFFPLDDRGVLVCDIIDRDDLEAYNLDIGSLLATYLTTAFERADREALLRVRERRLERQRDELVDLNHVNQIMRDINRALVRVSTREEIERLVCEQLAAADRYEFAWIGSYAPGTREIHPASWAGIGNGAFENRPLSIDGTKPIETAVSRIFDRDSSSIVTHPPPGTDGTGRESQTDSSLGASAIVPIHYQDVTYGVLVVFLDATDAFADQERKVLEELGETVGYAISAAEWRRSRVGEAITEVELSVSDDESFFVELSTRSGCEIEISDVHARADGGIRMFARVFGESAETIQEVADKDDDVVGITIYEEQEDEINCEFTIRSEPLASNLGNAGVAFSSAMVADGAARILLRAPLSTDVRRLVDWFRSTFDSVDLVSRRERPSSQKTAAEFHETVTEEFTPRQLEVFRVAYHAGYFGWPRGATGEEVAAALDIAQPTFHEHMRNIEQTLAEGFFAKDLSPAR